MLVHSLKQNSPTFLHFNGLGYSTFVGLSAERFNFFHKQNPWAQGDDSSRYHYTNNSGIIIQVHPINSYTIFTEKNTEGSLFEIEYTNRVNSLSNSKN
jgi:hypothetical protein